jgi:hypothetical protein
MRISCYVTETVNSLPSEQKKKRGSIYRSPACGLGRAMISLDVVYSGRDMNKSYYHSTEPSLQCKGRSVSTRATLTAHDQMMYITIEFYGDVESHKADDDGSKGQYPCEDIHDK